MQIGPREGEQISSNLNEGKVYLIESMYTTSCITRITLWHDVWCYNQPMKVGLADLSIISNCLETVVANYLKLLTILDNGISFC